MKQLVWFLKWALKAAIFFTLFAFALTNEHDVTVHFFFGRQWTAPLVLVVLTAFAIGLVIGVLGMVPRWWQHRRAAALARQAGKPSAATAPEKTTAPPSRPPY
jgi:lipopolysaccharide assembly protein A